MVAAPAAAAAELGSGCLSGGDVCKRRRAQARWKMRMRGALAGRMNGGVLRGGMLTAVGFVAEPGVVFTRQLIRIS